MPTDFFRGLGGVFLMKKSEVKTLLAGGLLNLAK
jgi:hypothetical protein